MMEKIDITLNNSAATSGRPAVAYWRLWALAGGAISAPLILGAFHTPTALQAIGLSIFLTGLSFVLFRRRADDQGRFASPDIIARPMPEMRPAHEPPFGLILDRLEDPVLLVTGGHRLDPGSWRFVYANAAARSLLRIQRAEGPLSTAMRAPEVLATVEKALFDRAAGEAWYDSGGAQDRTWRARTSPLDGSGPDPRPADAPRALLTLRDETESRRSERTRADFLANASHELRTPLASLTGFIETLRGHARDDPAARDAFLAIMHAQADRMRRLIEDLMSLSRIELGEHIRPSGVVDLSLAVVDVLDALEPLAQAKNVSFQTQIPAPGEALAQGDRDQILQVIQNLTENALKYSPSGAAVAVEVVSNLKVSQGGAPISPSAGQFSLLTPDHVGAQAYLALSVRDSGQGIARSDLPRLTERFFRVAGQKSGDHAGTGLGLAIVKHIVNRHQGGLTVESVEGQGASFTVYLPILAAEA